MGELFRRTWILIQRNGKASAIAVAILTPVLGIFGRGIIGVAALVYAQYELTYTALSRIDLLDSGYRKRRFLAVAGLLLLNYLIVTIGLILFILPGIFLAARLIASVPALISEEAGVFEAMQISWDRTRNNTLSICLALAVLFVVSAGALFGMSMTAVGLSGLFGTLGDDLPVWAAMLLGIGVMALLAAMLVTYWHLAIAVYAGSRSEQDIEDVTHIFA